MAQSYNLERNNPLNIKMLFSSANVFHIVSLDVQLYHFYESDPQPEKKGKINLKDYCF